ncbi:MAG: ATP synthase F0 subunit B [Candidatus Eremiobacteraeota bacterium]|nr:ATP synthase F0 subunit B [Candidatus Eremiobacteraeota bacterium]
MFLSIDGTIFIQLINFLIFFALLNVVFLRPVGAAIKRRREYINGVQSDYDRYAKEASALRSDANERRGAARRAAEESVVKARLAAEDQAQQIMASETARAYAIVDHAHQTVAAEVAVARGREGDLSQQLAKTLLARALGRPAPLGSTR